LEYHLVRRGAREIWSVVSQRDTEERGGLTTRVTENTRPQARAELVAYIKRVIRNHSDYGLLIIDELMHYELGLASQTILRGSHPVMVGLSKEFTEVLYEYLHGPKHLRDIRDLKLV